MAKKSRLLLLVPRLNEDGTTHMVRTLLRGLNRAKYHLTLCALSPGNASLDQLQPLVDRIEVLHMRCFWDFRVLWQLYLLLKRDQIELIHTHRIRPDLIGRLSGCLAHVPWNISTQHYVGEWHDRGMLVYRIVRALYRWTLRFSQIVICISEGERQALLAETDAELDGKIVVIHNGLDLATWTPPSADTLAALHRELALPPAARVLLCIAFLQPRKGHRYLLEACAQLLPSHPELYLLLAGSGPEEEALARRASALGMAQRTRFLGLRHDIPALLALSEVVVLASLWEPFGLAVLEAMAAGKPVVATRTGGLPEIVVEGETGFLVPPADAQALAKALDYLLCHRCEAHRMGQQGRTYLEERFTAQHVGRAYEAMYDTLLGSTEKGKSCVT